MIRPALFFSGIVTIFLIGLSACGGSATANTQVPARPTATTAVAPTSAVIPTSTPTVAEPVSGPPSQVGTCVGCHTTDGSRLVGPTWKGLFGTEEALEDGTTVTVDEAYLRESILDPGAKIVKGFPNAMPDIFKGSLSDSDLDIIIEYIKTLK